MFEDGLARRGTLSAVASVLLITMSCSVAAAQEPAVTVPSTAERPSAPNIVKQTYSGYVLLSDGLALTAFAVAVRTDVAPLGLAAVAGYALGGPAAHVAHGRPRTAIGSLTLRFLVPVVGAGLGAAVFSVYPTSRGRGGEEMGDPAAVGAVLGIAAGVLVAPILDATILARRAWFDPLRMAPAVSFSPHGGTLGLSGSF